MSAPETWKPVVGYEDRYEVSDLGVVRSLSGPKVMAPSPNRKGYPQLALRRGDPKSKTVFVHRLVLEAFVGPRPPGMECRHLNDNPADNRLSNLAWGTRKENMADKVRNGRPFRGERVPWSKLTNDKVLEARRLYREGWEWPALAEHCGVAESTIQMAVHGHSWKHLRDGGEP